MTIVRDVTPENTLTDLQRHAIAALHEADDAITRTDRAMAHVLRAALRTGLTWDDTYREIGVTQAMGEAYLRRWAGDQS